MFKDKETIKAMINLFASGLEIPLDQVCLGGGGALVVMGAREHTADLNLWIDSPYFEKIAEAQGVTNHPMTDTVVPVTLGMVEMETHGHSIAMPVTRGGERVTLYIRQRNRYFNSLVVDGVQIFDPLTLLTQKRGGFIESRRPAHKREQDHKDILYLNGLLAERNKVRDIV